ncbi:putative ABC multidrug transporter [Xylaria bambusicola]|uniref:putative ABC multidrug transporter n=1 Tax=Xylaria bambusicola TaxID=326684 RepID=UPI0020075762|nr:putative ABC multidrug transporter [Xylaria bambusicola]KAI0505431.1 putative ABC multidrug transporter [Xylaria bambusicola]
MDFSQGLGSLFEQDKAAFDFNLEFEQLFFSILPSAIFIFSSLWRVLHQTRKPVIVHAPTVQWIKLGAIATYVVLELLLLVLSTVGTLHVTRLFVAASALKLVSALFMMALSVIDHSRSPRPSVLLSSYLFLTLILDGAQARTLFLSSGDRPEITYSSIFIATIALKLSIFLLESQQKSKWISWDMREHSPEETSGIFSLGVYFWLNRLFLSGYSKVLKVKDLYPLDSTLDAKLLHERFSANMDYGKLKGDNFGLVKVLIRTLNINLLLPIPPRLAMLGFTIAQPFFTEGLLKYLSKPERDPNVGYGFIGASILIYAGIAVSAALCWYFHRRALAMTRSMLITETYIKATQARLDTGDDNTAVTLMSTDIERINMGFLSLHETWASLIQAALASWLLYNQLGAAFAAPIATVTICFFGLAILVKFTGDSQRSWMAGNQKRVGLTTTVISSMKNLKISGLSTIVGDHVQTLRVLELAAGARYRKITVIAAVFGYVPLLISPPLTFAFAQRTLDVPRIFTSLSYLLLLTNPLSMLFQNIPQLVSGLACLGRIQAFLECETRHDFRSVEADLKHHSERAPAQLEQSSKMTEKSSPLVVIKDGEFGWKANKFVLRGVNAQISQSSLTVIVGPVGSGKSTMCKALLGEIPFSNGSVTMRTRFPHVGFCDQTAFLSNGTIRDNIVGHSPFNEQRYAEVIKATALSFDLAMLPQNDMTNVGSDGITLSGGQKQRVSLARALYLQSDLLILDDIFSGLDADTEEQVFRQVFGPEGILRRRGTTVALCTHSIRHLPVADHIIAIGDGTIIEQGTFNELMALDGYIRRLGLRASSESDTSSKATPSKQHGMKDTAVDKPRYAPVNVALTEEDEGNSRQTGDTAVYKHYFKSMGVFLAFCSFFFATLWGFFRNFPTVWLTYWTNDVYSEHPNHTYAYYAGIYAVLQVSATISLLLLGISIFIISVRRAGANVHQDALRTLIRAPLSFFTVTDTGVVTNLFSQDLNLIDTELPNALLNTLFCIFQAIGQAAVMLTSSPYLAISYPFIGILLYVVQKFYLRTSRQLRLLDLESKSPLYTHFIDTVKGMVTLRAYGFVPDDVQKNVRLINTSQRPAYLLVMIQQWLNLVLDLVVAVIAAVLTALAVRLPSNSGLTGASLVTLMSFGDSLSGIVIYFTRLETSIGAILRLQKFNEAVKPEEKSDEDLEPPEDWPQKGVIEMKRVSASYQTDRKDNDNVDLALRNINFTANSGERIAICGRTGSGKSSLIALLLKLLDPIPEAESSVLIDGAPLNRISRPVLRQRIIAVPQEAVFLPDGSTFKDNLDPTGVATPAECEAVLAKVDLLQFVQDRGGTDAPMSVATFSAGQKQLMSLGRALLRRRGRARNLLGLTGSGVEGGILLLDEVSSNVDHETERIMQETIRTEFKGYTVVAVSHRLDTIMDFDRVVVMDKGEILEVGNPVALASQAGTRFHELIQASTK